MKYYISIFEKIKELYQAQSLNMNEQFMLCPSLRVYESKDLELLLPNSLTNAENKGLALLQKEDISYQLNSLPLSADLWDVNPDNTLFDAFREILETPLTTKSLPDEAIDPAANSVLYEPTGKQTAAFKLYEKYSKAYEKTINDYENHIGKYSALSSDQEKIAWEERLDLLTRKKEKALSDLIVLGKKETIENAFDKINLQSGYENFLKDWSNARTLLGLQVKTGIESLEQYFDLHFIPYDFMQTDNGWNKLELDKQELDNLYSKSEKFSDLMADGLIDFDYDDKFIKGIDLEFSVVTLLRNWFNKKALLSEYFRWEGEKPIADGTEISAKFLLPAYPKKIIFIRNLKIYINEEAFNTQKLDPLSVIKFGPIFLKNQVFTNKKSSENFFKAITNNRILKSEQLTGIENKLEEVIKPVSTRVVVSPSGPGSVIRGGFERISKPERVVNRDPGSIRILGREKLTASTIGNPVNKDLLIKTKLDLSMFNKRKLFSTGLSKVSFEVTDKANRTGVYKADIAIRGVNVNYSSSVETDADGLIASELPAGKYEIEIRKDGYEMDKSEMDVLQNTPLKVSKDLRVKNVSYKDFFLIGAICEMMPKIPR